MSELPDPKNNLADLMLQAMNLVREKQGEPTSAQPHDALSVQLSGLLIQHIRQHHITGHVGLGVRSKEPSNRPHPDVSLYLGVEDSVEPLIPDLAIEISTSPVEARKHAQDYLSHEARLVWLVYPATQQVEVCRLDENGDLNIQTLQGDDLLTGTPVLKEFGVPVKTIF